MRHLVRMLKAHPALAEAAGLSSVPSLATLSRRLRRLTVPLMLICRRLGRQVEFTWIGAVDATGLRTRVRGSRPGWCSAYGLYRRLKLHAVVTPSGLLPDFVLTPGHVREKPGVFPLYGAFRTRGGSRLRFRAADG